MRTRGADRLFSQGGWFYGVTHGLGVKNIYLRRTISAVRHPGLLFAVSPSSDGRQDSQSKDDVATEPCRASPLSLSLPRTCRKSTSEPNRWKSYWESKEVRSRTYFQHFSGMIKLDAPGESSRDSKEFTFDFNQRNRRPPRDPVNALLSLAYSVLSKDLTIVSHTVGFDPFLGFYHQPRFGRAALALDLMEPFRPLIADSAVLSAINTRMVTPRDFVSAGNSVALKPEGRKAFFRAYEQRMDSLVTHPMFGYRVNYRRILEIQARLLARVLTGELTTYPVFTTR